MAIDVLLLSIYKFNKIFRITRKNLFFCIEVKLSCRENRTFCNIIIQAETPCVRRSEDLKITTNYEPRSVARHEAISNYLLWEDLT